MSYWTTTKFIMISMYAMDDSRTHKDPWMKGTPKSQKQRFAYPRKAATPSSDSDDEDGNAIESPSPSRPVTPMPATDDNDVHPQTPAARDRQLSTPDPTPARQHTSTFNHDTYDKMVNTELQTKHNMRKMADDLQEALDEGQAELNGTPPQDLARRHAEARLASLRALQENCLHAAEK